MVKAGWLYEFHQLMKQLNQFHDWHLPITDSAVKDCIDRLQYVATKIQDSFYYESVENAIVKYK